MGSHHDPLADLLTRLRNASHARHLFIDVGHSKLKEAIVRILKDKGFIAHYLIKEGDKKGTIRVFLKYDGQRNPLIHGLNLISKQSMRRYVSYKEIPRIQGGMGISILSTSKGVMAGEDAKRSKVGGELLLAAW